MPNSRNTTLVAVPSLSYQGHTSSNRLIEGDNMQVLATLPSESVDFIYREKRKSCEQRGVIRKNGASLWGINDPCFDPARLRAGDIPLQFPFPLGFYQEPFELGCQSWGNQQSGHNQDARRLLNAIMGGDDHLPMTPKPLKLIEKIIQLWCPLDGVVLDAFAGSGTTGHAVLDLNARVGSRRSFILIEQGNPTTGDHFARTLTAERLRRVISGERARERRDPLPGGFTFQQVVEAGEVHSSVQIVRKERSA